MEMFGASCYISHKILNAEHMDHPSRSIEYKRKVLEIPIVKNEFINSESKRRNLLGALGNLIPLQI